MLRRCQNGHVFNERRHGTICPYCNIDTAGRRSSLTSDALAQLPASHEVARPVCGWIVCVEGPSKGNDYKIRAGKNFIGRGDDMDIQILGDNEISQSKHAIIAYDSKNRKTTLLPGDSNGIAYWKDEPVYTPVQLEANDVIEMGESRFVFMPFCGDNFSWSDSGRKAKETGAKEAPKDAETEE
jgi:hypothetical protein